MLVFATVNCFHIICRIHTKYLLHLINDPPTHKYLTNEIPIIIGFLIVCAQNVSTEMSEMRSTLKKACLFASRKSVSGSINLVILK